MTTATTAHATGARHAEPPAPHAAGEPMSHREVLEALSGLLLGLFVAILSSTVVSNALPIIVPDLGGSESGYTWVVTASLLATTISTPIWGKLADLFSKKLLVQISLVVFVIASGVAGLSQNMTMLISMRVLQGLGAGGLTALTQVILASMISPRERGRYSGYLGATFALATVGGPVIGGVLTDHLSWRWCFYVGVPFALAALVVLQKTLHLPTVRKDHVRIDYLGATVLAAGVSCLLIWVSLGGQQFDWWSWQTAAMVPGGLLLLALTVLVERKVAEPIIPLRLFSSPTIVLSSLASIFVGVALFGGTVFLSQYFQLARGESPTMSGILTMPLVIGLFLSSTIAGQFITRTGRWKYWIVAGGILLTAGLGLMSTVVYDTEYWVVAPYMFLVGAGVGMMMQNLVLAVQNVVQPQDLGVASSFVAFSRSLGGAIGVSALGAVLANRVTHYLTDSLTAAHISASALGSADGGVPDLARIPEPVRAMVQAAYGSGIADIFLVAAPFAFVALVISFFFKEIALRGARDAQAAPVAQAEPQPQLSSEIVAQRSPGVSGTVRLADGRPLAGAVLTLTDHAGRQAGRAVSDADGRYHLATTTTGSHLLIAAAEGTDPFVASLAVSGTTAADVVLTGRSAVTGRVLADSPAAAALPDAVVTLTDVTGRVVGTTRTDASGAYSFEGLAGGAYVLTARSGAGRPAARSVDVPQAEVLAVDLEASGGGRVTGTVVAADGGAPLAHSGVTLVGDDGEVVASGVTDADGTYTFAGLPGGRYTVIAAGWAPVASGVEVVQDAASAVHLALGGPATEGAHPLGSPSSRREIGPDPVWDGGVGGTISRELDRGRR